MQPQTPSQFSQSQLGGAALEYVLVTTFAALTGIAALSFAGKIVKDRLAVIADKLGIEADVGDWDPFAGKEN